jgi:SAM-dependent methyltransferase
MRTAPELLDANRRFYDSLWTDARFVAPERFNTWPLASALAAQARRRLEVAPGLRPRLPLTGTCFVDISVPALLKLRAHGGNAVVGLVTDLPFPDAHFDLVCALDIIEHVDDDAGALAELARVAAPGAMLLTSVPLHASQWTVFDDFVGHQRRYDPRVILEKLAQHGFALEQSAVFGMSPRSPRLLELGTWYLTHRRERAMWWYNRVMVPLGVRFQKKLALRTGLIDTDGVDEVLLLCRRAR